MPAKKKHIIKQFGTKKNNPRKTMKNALKKKELDQFKINQEDSNYNEGEHEISLSRVAIEVEVLNSIVVEPSQPSQHSKSNNSVDISTETNNPVTEENNKIRKKIIPMPGTRRLVDINFYHEQIKNFSNHNPYCNASFSHSIFFDEFKDGLNSKLIFKCQLCNFNFNIYTNRPIVYEKQKIITSKKQKKKNQKINTWLETNISENDQICENPDCKRDINYDAVLAITNIGSGFSHLEEIMLNLNTPCMSKTYFQRMQRKLCKNYDNAATKCMHKAVEEEIELARAHGDFKDDETPLLTVIVDGCWSKRSYRANYSALSGCAVIIGFYTKKVLWFGVRNKYCVICERAKNSNEIITEAKYLAHKVKCNINYSGASTGMETSILVEGFKKSLPLYGVIYKYFIGDGDSSLSKKLTTTDKNDRIYVDVDIQKIECKNHLMRNLDRKLRELVSGKTKNKYTSISNINFGLKYRKILGNRAHQIRRDIRAAVKHWKNVKVSDHIKSLNLEKDLRNIPSHVFGCHSNCADYFKCKNVAEIDYTKEAHEDGILKELSCYLLNLSIHSKSLIKDLDTNAAEQFNSIVAKHVGGKKINYSLGISYGMRCSAAVVQFNTGKSSHYLQENVNNVDTINKSPLLQMYARRKKTNISKKRCFKRKPTTMDNDYGRFAERPTLDPGHYNLQKEKILEVLKENHAKRDLIEQSTREQANNASWTEIRKLMLTASNFGPACTGTLDGIVASNKAQRIVLNKPIYNKAMMHGKLYEDVARNQLVKQLKKGNSSIDIAECGLFIDEEYHFLGASPDGLVNDGEGIVEIKCPYNSFNCEIGSSIKKMKFLSQRKNTYGLLRKGDSYYYQIQGQLHVTKRKYCYFAIWTSHSSDLKIEIIERDDEFWNGKMKDNLIKFYNTQMLPKLIDIQSRL
jgi:hypothetical protein